jgi:hypothetical protein
LECPDQKEFSLKRVGGGFVSHIAQNFPYFLYRSTIKPFHKLGGTGSCLQVLKQGGNRQARTPEYPSSTDSLWVPFDCLTFGPIYHFCIVALSKFFGDFTYRERATDRGDLLHGVSLRNLNAVPDRERPAERNDRYQHES